MKSLHTLAQLWANKHLFNIFSMFKMRYGYCRQYGKKKKNTTIIHVTGYYPSSCVWSNLIIKQACVNSTIIFLNH